LSAKNGNKICEISEAFVQLKCRYVTDVLQLGS